MNKLDHKNPPNGKDTTPENNSKKKKPKKMLQIPRQIIDISKNFSLLCCKVAKTLKFAEQKKQ